LDKNSKVFYIYDNLDYNNWKKDINLIHNAEYNIGVGEGG
jgi:hypothetical protein